MKAITACRLITDYITCLIILIHLKGKLIYYVYGIVLLLSIVLAIITKIL